jgi:RNA polymerase sigma-70 factor (ECF subfamily)
MISTVHLSDGGLLALCARGDSDAFAALYDRYARPAYSLALRIVRDPALAEDVVQDAFLAVWRGAARFDGRRARPSTWILSLVHHKAIDIVRRESSRRTEREEAAPEPVAADNVPHDAWLRLQREQVQTALASLPDPQREVLELSYFGGYSQSELATRLGQPLGTIKSRTHAGLSRLRELLEREDITTENPWSTESSSS